MKKVKNLTNYLKSRLSANLSWIVNNWNPKVKSHSQDILLLWKVWEVEMLWFMEGGRMNNLIVQLWLMEYIRICIYTIFEKISGKNRILRYNPDIVCVQQVLTERFSYLEGVIRVTTQTAMFWCLKCSTRTTWDLQDLSKMHVNQNRT
jgi:hypothetical protein